MERRRRDDRGAVDAEGVGWSLGRGFSLPSGERFGERLCLSTENFWNFYLEIACYSAFGSNFLGLTVHFYRPNRNTNTASNELMLSTHTHTQTVAHSSNRRNGRYILPVFTSCKQCKSSRPTYTVSQRKKHDTILVPVTSPNVNLCSKIFDCYDSVINL